jgi:hypothetical protein
MAPTPTPTPTRTHIARRSFQASTQEGRVFLQARISTFARLMFMVMAGYFVFMLGTRAIFGELVVNDGKIGAVLIVTALSGLGGLWWFTRGKLRSALIVNILDFACAFDPSALIAISVYMMGDLAVAPFGGWVGVSLMIFARALVVPSTAKRTAVVSGLAVTPLLIVNGFLTHALPPEKLMLPPDLQTALFVAWGIIATVITAYGSGVIWGLREQIREARQLGQYTLLAKLGEGGMGVVYRAQHAMLRRPTAIKLLPPEKAGEQQLVRFEREVQHTAELTHPNTVQIFDYGRSPDGVFYYAMEFLDGIDLEELVEKFGAQPPARVIHLVRQLLGSLSEAHATGLVHRDVKPANVYLCHRGGIPDVVKVLDFGLVKELQRDGANLTDVNVIAGTPAYLAPEAITAPDEVGPAADLYAVGAVAYYLLTGENVFDGATIVEVCGHHVHSEPEPPSSRLGEPVDEDLEDIILGCLAKKPEDRPESARALITALDALPDAHGWSDADAEKWWKDVEDQLATKRDDTRKSGVATIEVDLSHRIGA